MRIVAILCGVCDSVVLWIIDSSVMLDCTNTVNILWIAPETIWSSSLAFSYSVREPYYASLNRTQKAIWELEKRSSHSSSLVVVGELPPVTPLTQTKWGFETAREKLFYTESFIEDGTKPWDKGCINTWMFAFSFGRNGAESLIPLLI